MEPSSRQGMVDATLALMVARGFAATSVDEICAAAGVSKGAFFHHFKSKDDAAKAAIDSFVAATIEWQKAAPGANDPDPLRRALAFVDHNIRFVRETPPEPFGCILGNAASELAETRPHLRRAAAAGLKAWTQPLADALAEAAKHHGRGLDARSLADHFSDAFQGGIVVARAHDDPLLLVRSLTHYRTYLEMMFHPSSKKTKM